MDNWSEFVEGRLTGVLLHEQGDVIDIYLSDRFHRKHTMTASGVKDARIWEMRQKNIIDRISLWDASSPEAEYREHLSFLMYGEQADKNKDSPLSRSALDQATQSIREGRTVLLEIEPVYGALVLIQAGKVVISPQP